MKILSLLYLREDEIDGLTDLVRLCQHHAFVISQNSHTVVTHVIKEISNLRSQVCRAAIQASSYLFIAAKMSDPVSNILISNIRKNQCFRQCQAFLNPYLL